jgi:hypothetical protein
MPIEWWKLLEKVYEERCALRKQQNKKTARNVSETASMPAASVPPADTTPDVTDEIQSNGRLGGKRRDAS